MRPQVVTYLKKGKAIGNEVHKGFADTFNWIVDVSKNLRGDDVCIEVDRTDQSQPIIRLTENAMEMLAKMGEGSVDNSNQLFWYDEANKKIINNYFYVGRRLKVISDVTVNNWGLWYLSIYRDGGSTNSIMCVSHASTINSMPSSTSDYTYYPLWIIDENYKPILDCRFIPVIPFYTS